MAGFLCAMNLKIIIKNAAVILYEEQKRDD